MSEVRISTPRGRILEGTFKRPVNSRDAAVLFSHSFLADRHSGEHFCQLAKAYRCAGYATLEFDYSGHGTSDDEIITDEARIEDLKAASGWLVDQGLPHQIVHGHSFGSIIALKARPSAVVTMILSGAVLGPLTYDWNAIFSPVQLDELEDYGVTTIPNDSPGMRRNFTISKQTLADLSLNNGAQLLDGLSYPILVIHDADDVDAGLVELSQESFSRMADGSRVDIFSDARFSVGEKHDVLIDKSVRWALQHMPINR